MSVPKRFKFKSKILINKNNKNNKNYIITMPNKITISNFTFW